MKIKHKLRLGFGLLFLVVIFFGGLSLFYIRIITSSNNLILRDNYATLKYVDEMRTVLESSPDALSPAGKDAFKTSLAKQKANVTEPGERQAVDALANAFDRLNNSNVRDRQESRTNALFHLRSIARLNLDAIERKSAGAQDRIRKATILLGDAACLTFVILFSFVFNLAGFFDAPVEQVSAAMREVGREKTFQGRLDFDRSDEFGEISEAFNYMNTSLNHWDQERQAYFARERRISEMLGEQVAEPVIVVRGPKEVLYCNTPARELFGLKAATDPNLTLPLENYENGPVTIQGNAYLLEILGIPAALPLPDPGNEDEALYGRREFTRMYLFRQVRV